MTEEKARRLTDCWFCNRVGCFMKYRYQRLWREASPGALSTCPRLAEALKAEEGAVMIQIVGYKRACSRLCRLWHRLCAWYCGE